MDNQLDGDALDRLRAEAQQKITELRAEINTLNEQLRLGTDDIMLPAPVIPNARVGDLCSLPYIADSTLSFTELTRRLRELKQYSPNDGDDA